MVTCWRCGVDFDNEDYISGAPCEDCQLDFSESYLKVSVARAKEEARVTRLITEHYAKRLSDSEIAEAIGMSRSQVLEARRKLGLPAHKFKGDEKWRDPEKVRADLRKRLTENPIVGYRRSTSRQGVKAPLKRSGY